MLGITAAELKGISDGISKMADNYQVADDANVKMVLRLQKEAQW